MHLFARRRRGVTARTSLNLTLAAALIGSGAAAGLASLAAADTTPNQELFFDGFESGLGQWAHTGDAQNSGTYSWDGAFSDSPTAYHCGGGSQTESLKIPVSPNTTYYLHLAYLTQTAANEGGYVAAYQYDSNGLRLSETWVMGFQGGGVGALMRLPQTLNTWGDYTQSFTTGATTSSVTIAPEDWPGASGQPCGGTVPAGHHVYFDDVELTTGAASLHPAPTFDLNSLGVGGLASQHLWVAADTLAASQANGSAVTAWPDLSGNSNDLTTGATAPTLSTSSFNGHAAVQFSGAAPNLVSAKNMQSGAAPYDVFMVAQPASGSFPQELGYFGWGHEFNDGHEVVLRSADGAGNGLDTYWWWHDDVTGTTPSHTSPNVIESYYNGSTRGMSLNGTSISNFAGSGKNTDATPFRLGSADVTGNTYVQAFSGKIAEALVYEGALTSCQRLNITAYLTQKYLGQVSANRCAPPQVTLTGVSDGSTYEHGAVPAPMCNVTSISGTTSSAAATTVVGSRSSAGLGTVTATCSYTDSQGLSGAAKATYAVVDTTAPVVTVPGNQTAEAVGADGAAVTFTAPTATDEVDGTRPVDCDHASGDTYPIGTTTVSCTSTDIAGNTSAAKTFTVKVADTTPPALTLPGNVTVTATGMTTPASWDAPTASDAVDGTDSVVCAHSSGESFPVGLTTVSCSATDVAGNKATGSFTVTVSDIDAPSFTVPANITAEATGPSGAVVTYDAPSASDAVNSSITPTCSSSSGDTFPLGTTTVACSAVGATGKSTDASFTVTVADTTKPVVTVPADFAVEATGPLGAVVHYVSSAHDTVSGDLPTSCAIEDGAQLGLGGHSVDCSATDGSGNVGTASFSVTVRDTTAPHVTPPVNVTAEATSGDGAQVNYSGGSATDIVDGTDTVNCLPASGSAFPMGASTVTCMATDGHHNTGTATFSVDVVDTTAPTIALPANQVVEATGPSGATATYAATATDIVDGTDAVTCTPSSGSTFALGTHTVHCATADAAGNAAADDFTVKVVDTTAPIVSVPATVTAEATGPSGAVVSYPAATAHDTVDGDLTPTCSPLSGSTFGLGTTHVVCKATDNDSNVGSNTFDVVVVDTTPPMITVPANISTIATSNTGATVTFAAASAADIVDGTDAVSCNRASGTTFALGTTTVTCSSTDRAGNPATKTFTVTVAYAWSGVQSPVVAGASYKLGRTIPVQFTLTGASAPITNAVVKLYVAKLGDSTHGTDAPAASTSAASAGNTFRWTGSNYVFNLDTKTLSAGTWQLKLDFGDGAARTVTIVLS